MKNNKINIKTIIIILLICINISFLLIILNMKNKNIEGQEIAKEQLTETTSSNAYVDMATHLSEINAKQEQLDNVQNTAGQATATADKILKDYTAYKDGQLITGTMANNGAVTKSLAVGGSYTIPAGYHNGSGKVTNAVTNKGTLTLGSTNGTAVDITDGYYTHVNTTAVYNAGKSNSLTYLGSTSGGTFNATSINGYKNLSEDNFLLVVESIPATTIKSTSSYACFSATGGVYSTFTMTKSYNANTGILTYPSSITCFANVINGDGGNNYRTANVQITYGVYLK